MKTKFNYLLSLLIISLSLFLSGCSQMESLLQEVVEETSVETIQKKDEENSKGKSSDILADLKIDADRWQEAQSQNKKLSENEVYYSVEEVAAYIHQYQKLPPNYITKSQAEQRNWTTSDKEWVVGGDRFGNREGKLPKASGRQYYEADIQAGYSHHRGPERLVYSNDGLIFYTDNHYDSFEQLY
ncbi:ribonuclease domain-containing protein [Facklamia sp. 7083-14-GEN3]|uniref:ribonuclease domain-containing protein n=1 Tax=Facklamia sp. 7083-14-GEN3 TaxID=2973478 RepID=UPI00215BE196|nr:ribonuclease domain-containing protein [Facklamia sp. 7083-14-GEN3]MCR8968510.1 ribonuclease [Facklamia sp. 7083-14-GEN3]